MKIDKIKRLPSGKYKILLDNNDKIITYDDVLIKNKVLYDKELTLEKLKDISKDTKYYDIYNRIIKMISTKLRSKKEILDFISKEPILEKEKKEIIKRLTDSNLINDEIFAKAFISDKIYLSNYGPYKIKEELLKHDIEESIIDEELAKIDTNDIINKIKKMINKKITNNTKYSSYMLKQKTLYELSNLGFDKDMIMEIYDSYNVDNNSLIEREFNKWYAKLSKKLEGTELKYKIKEKLYQKGFDIDSINSIISKM